MNDSTKYPSITSLKEIKLLKIFKDEDLQTLVKLGEDQEYEPYSNIVIEGELTWGLYIILEGIVGIYKTNKLTGDNYDVGQLRAGSFFGEMSLVDENARSATVTSLTKVKAFYISKDKFYEFLNKGKDLPVKFYSSCIKDLVQRLRELDDDFVISQYQLWKTAVKKEAA